MKRVVAISTAAPLLLSLNSPFVNAQDGNTEEQPAPETETNPDTTEADQANTDNPEADTSETQEPVEGSNPIYFHDLTATGDLTKPVTDDTTCLATGAPPVAFTSQAPQFCLISSSAERCCTPSHDVFIKDHVAGLWPTDCASDEYPGLNELACLICSQD